MDTTEMWFEDSSDEHENLLERAGSRRKLRDASNPLEMASITIVLEKQENIEIKQNSAGFSRTKRTFIRERLLSEEPQHKLNSNNGQENNSNKDFSKVKAQKPSSSQQAKSKQNDGNFYEMKSLRKKKEPFLLGSRAVKKNPLNVPDQHIVNKSKEPPSQTWAEHLTGNWCRENAKERFSWQHQGIRTSPRYSDDIELLARPRKRSVGSQMPANHGRCQPGAGGDHKSLLLRQSTNEGNDKNVRHIIGKYIKNDFSNTTTSQHRVNCCYDFIRHCMCPCFQPLKSVICRHHNYPQTWAYANREYTFCQDEYYFDRTNCQAKCISKSCADACKSHCKCQNTDLESQPNAARTNSCAPPYSHTANPQSENKSKDIVNKTKGSPEKLKYLLESKTRECNKQREYDKKLMKKLEFLRRKEATEGNLFKSEKFSKYLSKSEAAELVKCFDRYIDNYEKETELKTRKENRNDGCSATTDYRKTCAEEFSVSQYSQKTLQMLKKMKIYDYKPQKPNQNKTKENKQHFESEMKANEQKRAQKIEKYQEYLEKFAKETVTDNCINKDNKTRQSKNINEIETARKSEHFHNETEAQDNYQDLSHKDSSRQGTSSTAQQDCVQMRKARPTTLRVSENLKKEMEWQYTNLEDRNFKRSEKDFSEQLKRQQQLKIVNNETKEELEAQNERKKSGKSNTIQATDFIGHSKKTKQTESEKSAYQATTNGVHNTRNAVALRHSLQTTSSDRIFTEVHEREPHALESQRAKRFSESQCQSEAEEREQGVQIEAGAKIQTQYSTKDKLDSASKQKVDTRNHNRAQELKQGQDPISSTSSGRIFTEVHERDPHALESQRARRFSESQTQYSTKDKLDSASKQKVDIRNHNRAQELKQGQDPISSTSSGRIFTEVHRRDPHALDTQRTKRFSESTVAKDSRNLTQDSKTKQQQYLHKELGQEKEFKESEEIAMYKEFKKELRQSARNLKEIKANEVCKQEKYSIGRSKILSEQWQHNDANKAGGINSGCDHDLASEFEQQQSTISETSRDEKEACKQRQYSLKTSTDNEYQDLASEFEQQQITIFETSKDEREAYKQRQYSLKTLTHNESNDHKYDNNFQIIQTDHQTALKKFKLLNYAISDLLKQETLSKCQDCATKTFNEFKQKLFRLSESLKETSDSKKTERFAFESQRNMLYSEWRVSDGSQEAKDINSRQREHRQYPVIDFQQKTSFSNPQDRYDYKSSPKSRIIEFVDSQDNEPNYNRYNMTQYPNKNNTRDGQVFEALAPNENPTEISNEKKAERLRQAKAINCQKAELINDFWDLKGSESKVSLYHKCAETRKQAARAVESFSRLQDLRDGSPKQVTAAKERNDNCVAEFKAKNENETGLSKHELEKDDLELLRPLEKDLLLSSAQTIESPKQTNLIEAKHQCENKNPSRELLVDKAELELQYLSKACLAKNHCDHRNHARELVTEKGEDLTHQYFHGENYTPESRQQSTKLLIDPGKEKLYTVQCPKKIQLTTNTNQNYYGENPTELTTVEEDIMLHSLDLEWLAEMEAFPRHKTKKISPERTSRKTPLKEAENRSDYHNFSRAGQADIVDASWQIRARNLENAIEVHTSTQHPDQQSREKCSAERSSRKTPLKEAEYRSDIHNFAKAGQADIDEASGQIRARNLKSAIEIHASTQNPDQQSREKYAAEKSSRMTPLKEAENRSDYQNFPRAAQADINHASGQISPRNLESAIEVHTSAQNPDQQTLEMFDQTCKQEHLQPQPVPKLNANTFKATKSVRNPSSTYSITTEQSQTGLNTRRADQKPSDKLVEQELQHNDALKQAYNQRLKEKLSKAHHDMCALEKCHSLATVSHRSSHKKEIEATMEVVLPKTKDVLNNFKTDLKITAQTIIRQQDKCFNVVNNITEDVNNKFSSCKSLATNPSLVKEENLSQEIKFFPNQAAETLEAPTVQVTQFKDLEETSPDASEAQLKPAVIEKGNFLISKENGEQFVKQKDFLPINNMPEITKTAIDAPDKELSAQNYWEQELYESQTPGDAKQWHVKETYQRVQKSKEGTPKDSLPLSEQDIPQIPDLYLIANLELEAPDEELTANTYLEQKNYQLETRHNAKQRKLKEIYQKDQESKENTPKGSPPLTHKAPDEELTADIYLEQESYQLEMWHDAKQWQFKETYQRDQESTESTSKGSPILTHTNKPKIPALNLKEDLEIEAPDEEFLAQNYREQELCQLETRQESKQWQYTETYQRNQESEESTPKGSPPLIHKNKPNIPALNLKEDLEIEAPDEESTANTYLEQESYQLIIGHDAKQRKPKETYQRDQESKESTPKGSPHLTHKNKTHTRALNLREDLEIEAPYGELTAKTYLEKESCQLETRQESKQWQLKETYQRYQENKKSTSKGSPLLTHKNKSQIAASNLKQDLEGKAPDEEQNYREQELYLLETRQESKQWQYKEAYQRDQESKTNLSASSLAPTKTSDNNQQQKCMPESNTVLVATGRLSVFDHQNLVPLKGILKSCCFLENAQADSYDLAACKTKSVLSSSERNIISNQQGSSMMRKSGDQPKAAAIETETREVVTTNSEQTIANEIQANNNQHQPFANDFQSEAAAQRENRLNNSYDFTACTVQMPAFKQCPCMWHTYVEMMLNYYQGRKNY